VGVCCVLCVGGGVVVGGLVRVLVKMLVKVGWGVCLIWVLFVGIEGGGGGGGGGGGRWWGGGGGGCWGGGGGGGRGVFFLEVVSFLAGFSGQGGWWVWVGYLFYFFFCFCGFGWFVCS